MAKSAERKKGGLFCEPGSSKAQQQFKDECDLNVMVRRFGGIPPAEFGAPVGRYGDFSSAPDFFEAQQLLLKAQAQFDGLPSAVRRRFDNDPAKLLAFVGDRSNLAEARELGLLKEEVAEAAAVDAPAKEGAK